jgi:HD-GYP domain-containing protein (c-di-GMP phosphodiesterase class II)
VADAFDAMTSHRPYREAMPSLVARLRLAQAGGTQFDPAVVAAFEATLVSKGTDPSLGCRLRDDLPAAAAGVRLERRGAA